MLTCLIFNVNTANTVMANSSNSVFMQFQPHRLSDAVHFEGVLSTSMKNVGHRALFVGGHTFCDCDGHSWM